MKRPILSLLLLAALLLAALPAQVAYADGPTPVLDASFSGDTNAMATLDAPYHFVAQTFTAHTTGALTAIRVEISSMAQFSLHFGLHSVTGGTPNPAVLGEGGIVATGDMPYIVTDLTRDIQIYPPVYVVAGQQYAIVAEYYSNGPGEGSGNWWGAVGDGYAEGAVFVTNDGSFASWMPASTPGMDLHFQTYVVPNVPVSDLSIQLVTAPRHAKACQVFDMTYRLTNNGPDTAHNVALGIGLWDQFDAISIGGTPVGEPHPTYTLAQGESVLVTATIKVTAFVPGESRKGLVTGRVWSDDASTIPVDLNPANDAVDYMLPLIGKQRSGCPSDGR